MNRRSFFGFLAGAPLAVAAGKVAAVSTSSSIATLGIEIDYVSLGRQASRLRSLRQKLETDSSKVDAYPHYGGRGIGICDEWRDDFARFAADMGPKLTPAHSIDRKDTDGDYMPGNCRWATQTEQMANRRRVA